MDFGAYTRLIDQFPGLTHLHLQGMGEPMFHPRFFDMVRYAAEKDIYVTTNTNLTLLTVKRAHACVGSGLKELHASLDGATAVTYESIRRRARFANVLRKLQALVEIRERHASSGPRIHLVMVVMRQNLHELPQVVRLAHDLQIDAVFVQHLCHDFEESSLPVNYRPMREFVQAQTLICAGEGERVERYFAQARALAEELKLPLRLPRTQPRAHPPGTPGPTRCDWPWRGAYIAYTGQAMPCCMIATPDRLNFGNMAAGGVARVWNNEAYRAFRARLSSDDPPEVCRSCAVYAGTF